MITRPAPYHGPLDGLAVRFFPVRRPRHPAHRDPVRSLHSDCILLLKLLNAKTVPRSSQHSAIRISVWNHTLIRLSVRRRCADGPGQAPSRNFAVSSGRAPDSTDGRRRTVPPSRCRAFPFWKGFGCRGSGLSPRPPARCKRHFPSNVQPLPRRPYMSSRDPCRPGKSDMAAAVERELQLSADRRWHPFGSSHRTSGDGKGCGRMNAQPVAGSELCAADQ